MTTQLSLLAPSLGLWHANDPDTSRLAALANYERSASQRTRCLLALADAGEHGLTDYELSIRVRILRTAAGTRRKSLVAVGLVEVTGQRRATDTGCLADVYRITDAGRDEAARLREGK